VYVAAPLFSLIAALSERPSSAPEPVSLTDVRIVKN